MAKNDKLIKALQKTYESERSKDAEELHNALVEVIHEHKAAIYDTLFVLDIIRFELMNAKYKEIMGFVKTTDKPPLKKSKEK